MILNLLWITDPLEKTMDTFPRKIHTQNFVHIKELGSLCQTTYLRCPEAHGLQVGIPKAMSGSRMETKRGEYTDAGMMLELAES